MEDWDSVRSIYLQGLATGQATSKLPHLPGKSGIWVTYDLAAW
jgi:hypothetical protein